MPKSMKIISNLELCGHEIPIVFERKSKNRACICLPKDLDTGEKHIFTFRLEKDKETSSLMLVVDGFDLGEDNSPIIHEYKVKELK